LILVVFRIHNSASMYRTVRNIFSLLVFYMKTLQPHVYVLQRNSYGTPGAFLSVIFERIVGSRWNLLQNYCLFMQVLYMSKMLQPQQLALSGTLFHRVGRCSTAIQNHFTESGVLLIARLLSLGHPEGDCTGINLAP